MKLLESILNDTFITEDAQLASKIAKAKSIISQYTSRESSYNDTLLRVAAFSNGISKPNPDKPNEINVIPILNTLARNGLVIRKPNGTYKRTEAVSRLISQQVNTRTDAALSGDTSRDGKLQTTQTKDMGYMGGNASVADKLRNAPRSYKAGGKYSGAAKELVIKDIKENDPAWRQLPDSCKDMVQKLSTLSNPLYSFRVLKKLIQLQASKKGYTSFVSFVENMFKTQEYVEALMDLQSIGVVSDNKLNNAAINDIKKVIQYMTQPTKSGISAADKTGALLPKFMENSTKHTGLTYRAINNIVTNPKYKSILDIINTRLTDEQLDKINSTDAATLSTSPIKKTIKFLANTLNASDVNDLKNKINEKIKNREDYNSDENQEAKNTGRMDFFSKNFSL